MENSNNKSALVVEGGAMRGIFSTGILDAFLVNKFNPFDLHIGVSAGASNLAAYLAKMYQRNYKIFTDYSIRPDFINWRKFIFGGHLIDLDWLWDITIKEIRLDLKTICSNKGRYLMGLTDINTGQPVYIEPSEDNLEELLKASSSIPIFYRKFIEVEGLAYTDGGLADPIPVLEAYRQGATNIMVIRSRPFSYEMKPSSNNFLVNRYFKKYPMLKKALLNREKVYKEAIEFIRKPPNGIKVMEINPPEDFQTKRLTKDIKILNQDYKIGYHMGISVIEKWNNYI
ncbi:putative patatin/cPLA2 family phospholipase [Natranaerovirga pectinivora]|uniref:Putative patatin/cPLA2 family phospholipase n=1 Tax=Natranaerovirga pectinivora TaxID=682400 RepID=A0A4R3MH26_9FIRM|nr:patatin family protein [Natranaerovirga pectinivora]TCT12979.1 putative patatin/cPLA2 family phospholipase [Natranaerovirga pectinivora]